MPFADEPAREVTSSTVRAESPRSTISSSAASSSSSRRAPAGVRPVPAPRPAARLSGSFHRDSLTDDRQSLGYCRLYSFGDGGAGRAFASGTPPRRTKHVPKDLRTFIKQVEEAHPSSYLTTSKEVDPNSS